MQDDPRAGMELRNSWWSRPYEYAWTLQFADESATVLDAACGVSHPFKWEIGQRCQSAWAIDSDPRIANLEAIIQETYDDLGKNAYAILTNFLHFYHDMHIVQGSIFALPKEMPQFDRIFCISVFEHLYKEERRKALQEFAEHLAEDGLLILTVDYPEITPEVLIKLASDAGLVPAGDVSLELPKNRLTDGYLSIYRAVFKHKTK